MELELTIESKQTGSTETKRLPISSPGQPKGGRLVLGRGPESPVALEGTGLSREHLAFEVNGNGCEVIDLSANGTWVNGQRLTAGKKYPAKSTDRIEIPGYSLGCTVVAEVSKAPVKKEEPAKTPVPKTTPPAAAGSLFSSPTALELWTVVMVLAALVVLIIFVKL